MEIHNKNSNISLSTDIPHLIQDYMFTSKNLIRFTKHIIQNRSKNKLKISQNSWNNNNREPKMKQNINRESVNKLVNEIYKPKQKDSLFWCFYILKHGFSNYEMEINNQYFVVEKTQKFKYIELLRKNKDILKIHKIKPFTELEDDLANKDKISIKTFFALCILENINIMLIDKRKIYELLCVDIDEQHPVHIVHRNSQTYTHHIELNVSSDKLTNYKETYYVLSDLSATLKSIGSYKVDELLELCKKLNVNVKENENKKKLTKKDIYELLVLNY